MPRFWQPLGSFAVLAAALGLVSAGQDPPARPLPRVATLTPAGQAATPATPTGMTDEEILAKAGLSAADGAKLVAYLKMRTLSDSEQGKIKGIIQRFAADKFDDRQKASVEVETFGPAAIGPLRTAEKDPDPEIAYRATLALKKLENVPHSAVATAAARAVARLKPPGAAAALLGFLPLADTDTVAEDIREALIALAVKDGKAEPALVAALSDPSPLRRGAAYVALIEGGPKADRIRIKDAYPQVKEAIRNEADLDTKFRGLWALALTTREREYFPALIDLIPKLPRGRIWQLEELLLQLAGTAPPGGSFGKTPEALAKSRDAWAGWWAAKGGAVNLEKFEFTPRVTGHTILVQNDPRGFGQSGVLCLGPDLKTKWLITAPNFTPSDVSFLPNGNVLVTESQYSRVSERDPTGKVVRSQQVNNQVVAAEPTPDGNWLTIGRSGVMEFDKDGKQVYAYTRPNFDIVAGRRMPNGDTVILTTTPNGPNCFRIDSKGKETGKSYTLGRVMQLQGMDVTGDDKILVCEFDKVAEYDLKTGKMGWKFSANNPMGCQRLPNGNTLITLVNQSLVIEVTAEGEVVWEYQSKDGLRLMRAYRR